MSVTRQSGRIWIRPVASLVLVGLTGACGSPQPRETVASTAAVGAIVAPQQARLSETEPLQPLREFAPGLMARTLYVAESNDPYRIEVWDLLVGPGKKTSAVSLPGAAVIEIRSGRGVLTIAGKAGDVAQGAVISVNDGDQLAIENRAPDVGLIMRATVVRPRNR